MFVVCLCKRRRSVLRPSLRPHCHGCVLMTLWLASNVEILGSGSNWTASGWLADHYTGGLRDMEIAMTSRKLRAQKQAEEDRKAESEARAKAKAKAEADAQEAKTRAEVAAILAKFHANQQTVEPSEAERIRAIVDRRRN